MKSFLTILALLVSFAGNAQTNYWGQNVGGNSFQGSTYSGQQAMQVQQVRVGTVLDIRPVQIVQQPQSPSYTGATVGATIGGLAGSQMGKGNGRVALTVLTTVLGGVAGEAMGSAYNTTKVQALEIIVRMESGETLAITQAIDADAASIRTGDHVRLIQPQGWGGVSRVARIGSF